MNCTLKMFGYSKNHRKKSVTIFLPYTLIVQTGTQFPLLFQFGGPITDRYPDSRTLIIGTLVWFPSFYSVIVMGAYARKGWQSLCLLTVSGIFVTTFYAMLVMLTLRCIYIVNCKALQCKDESLCV